MKNKSRLLSEALITSVEVDSGYGINVHEQLRLIESGKLTPIERIRPGITPYPLRKLHQIRVTKYLTLSWEKIWSLDRQSVEELFFNRDQIEALSKPADCAEEITDKAASREEVARGARRDRVIRIIDLIDIMAEDETYTDILPALRKKFLLRSWIGPREFDDLLQTPEGRFRYWLNLIRRWAGLEANATEERLPYISYLQCYSHNSKTGRIEKVDRNGKPPHHKNFINLDELKKYLKNVEYIYQLQIPLPQRLYPDDTIVADEGEKQLSDPAKTKKYLCSHVTESVRSGLITCKDDLFRDPAIQKIMSDMNWSKETVKNYTRGCGIPHKKRGRPKAKNGTNTP